MRSQNNGEASEPIRTSTKLWMLWHRLLGGAVSENGSLRQGAHPHLEAGSLVDDYAVFCALW